MPSGFANVRTVAALVSMAMVAPSPGARVLARQGVTREWPCRLVVERPLLQLVEAGWRISETFRRQCRALADKRAVAVLQPGPERSTFTARTRIGVANDGTIIGRVVVQLDADTLEHIGHELEHILERAEGIDLALEARRNPSDVWLTRDGFETRRAIDAGRRIAREVRERSGSR